MNPKALKERYDLLLYKTLSGLELSELEKTFMDAYEKQQETNEIKGDSKGKTYALRGSAKLLKDDDDIIYDQAAFIKPIIIIVIVICTILFLLGFFLDIFR